MNRLIGALIGGVIFYLYGAFVEYDWLWVSHIEREDSRFFVALVFWFIIGIIVSCPAWGLDKE